MSESTAERLTAKQVSESWKSMHDDRTAVQIGGDEAVRKRAQEIIDSQSGVPKYRIQIDAHENRPDQPLVRGESPMRYWINNPTDLDSAKQKIRERLGERAEISVFEKENGNALILGVTGEPMPENFNGYHKIGGAQSAHKPNSEA